MEIQMTRLTFATIFLLFALFSSLALTQVQSPVRGPSLGSLTGTVLNSATGQPIEGVKVTVVPGQPIPERGVQSLEKPSADVPQTTKVIEGLVLGGRSLMPNAGCIPS
jgi:hypothetical protein